MARNYNNGGFSNGGYSVGNYQPSRGGYTNSRSNNNYGGQRPQKKHSGAKTGTTKKGEKYTTGWNKSRGAGFVTFLCVTTSKSVSSESKSGRKWVSVMVKVRKQMTPETTTNGLMDVQTGMVTIDSMGIVLNPKAPNGGYCGKFGK